jgi:small neutral amino acid transporter SnatA (MarC family)
LRKTTNEDKNVTSTNIDVKEVVKIQGARQVAITATLATFAIFVRFFVVVDIVINFFGKINVELGPKIGGIVKFLKKL